MRSTLIEMSELHEIWKKNLKDNLFLDVRSPEEFSEGHVPESQNIPFDEIEKVIADLKKFKAIYIYCRSGRRAQIASEVLEKHGIKNIFCVARGGFPEWPHT